MNAGKAARWLCTFVLIKPSVYPYSICLVLSDWIWFHQAKTTSFPVENLQYSEIKNISGQVDALFDALVWFKYNLNTFLYFQRNGGQIFLYLFIVTIVFHLVSVQGVAACPKVSPYDNFTLPRTLNWIRWSWMDWWMFVGIIQFPGFGKEVCGIWSQMLRMGCNADSVNAHGAGKIKNLITVIHNCLREK